MKAFYASILLILLASLTAGETISDINLWIGADGYTWVEERILVPGNDTVRQCQVIIPAHANDFSIADELGRLNYTIISDDKYDTVNYTPRQTDGGESSIWIKYGTPQLTSKNGINWTISYYTPATERQTIVRVNFPVGGKFVYLSPEILLRSFEKYAVWIFPQENSLSFNCTYEYSGNNTRGTEVNNTSGNYSTTTIPPTVIGPVDPTTIAVFVAAVIVVASVVFLARRMELFKKEMKNDKAEEQITVSVEKDTLVKGPSIVGDSLSYDIQGTISKKGKKIVKESVLKMLDDNEMAIVKIIEGSDEDELTQAYVHKTTGIPKSSLSDIIKRLEKRNIIESTSQGRTKWLKLQKWVLD